MIPCFILMRQGASSRNGGGARRPPKQKKRKGTAPPPHPPPPPALTIVLSPEVHPSSTVLLQVLSEPDKFLVYEISKDLSYADAVFVCERDGTVLRVPRGQNTKETFATNKEIARMTFELSTSQLEKLVQASCGSHVLQMIGTSPASAEYDAIFFVISVLDFFSMKNFQKEKVSEEKKTAANSLLELIEDMFFRVAEVQDMVDSTSKFRGSIRDYFLSWGLRGERLMGAHVFSTLLDAINPNLNYLLPINESPFKLRSEFDFKCMALRILALKDLNERCARKELVFESESLGMMAIKCISMTMGTFIDLPFKVKYRDSEAAICRKGTVEENLPVYELFKDPGMEGITSAIKLVKL